MRNIAEQISRMRSKGVEPEIIYMSPNLYKWIGRPHKFCGVMVDCDNRLKTGFEVR